MGNEKKKDGKKNKNREFAVVTYLFLAVFISMMGYFIYFLVAESESFINSSYNKRIDSFAAQTVRGKILSADGMVLAETLVDGAGNETRSYPYSSQFAHVVGFNSNGKAGLESYANFYLLRSHTFFVEKIGNDLSGEKDIGDNVITTLDTTLQNAAYQAMGSYDGAVVVMEPETGRVLAMVSKPDYDPDNIDAAWDTLVSDSENSSLMNRASQGLYPPGSTFKIFTTLEYIREHPDDYQNYSYVCDGSTTVEGVKIHCYNNRQHGTENLMESFANSCNSSYATLGLTLDIENFATLCDGMLFNQAVSFELPVSTSRFTLDSNSSTAEIMETVIGQGNTLVTPLQMVMTVSAIDNQGTAMKPYLVDSVENYKGIEVKSFSAEEAQTLMTETEAELLKTFMAETVNSGTAGALSGQSYTAYGKTGSAEYNDAGDSHAWFVGFASREDKPDIAVAVILEGAGAGSTYAVPAAKKIFDTYYAQ